MTTKNDYRFTERPSMFSKSYIKQCGQAKQIQKLCRYKKGDWFYTKAHGYHVISDDYIYFSDDPKTINWITRNKGVWLPMQEQLQEMMPLSDVTALVEYIKNVELRYHDRFNENAVGYFTGTFTTMNELWLAFVYKEIYYKIWTGKDWVREANKDKDNWEAMIREIKATKGGNSDTTTNKRY